MRGLKHFSLNRELHGHKSHLLQMRGLKHYLGKYEQVIKSHLLQMRGLKPPTVPNINIGNWVASFTDAWIETLDCLFLPHVK